MSDNFFTRNSSTFDGIKTLVELIGVPIAVVVFLWNYTEQVNAERIANSNRMVSQFFGEDVVKAKIAIEKELLKRDRVEALKNATKKSTNEGDICDFHNETLKLLDVVDPNNYLRVDSFFNSVAVCIESGGCDANTICSAMLGDVHSFRNAFCSVSDARAQSLSKSVASHYETILKKCEGSIPRSFCDVMRDQNQQKVLDYSKC